MSSIGANTDGFIAAVKINIQAIHITVFILHTILSKSSIDPTEQLALNVVGIIVANASGDVVAKCVRTEDKALLIRETGSVVFLCDFFA